MEDRLIGGRYRIVRKIAEGGMGAVYEAQHNLSKKSVALKVLFEHIGKDEAARQRFLREVSAPAQIGHDGIVEVYDAGFDTQDGSLFVAMELLDGEPLRDRLARGGLPLETILDTFEQVLDPLAAAHDKGIVHRDLKPENVFMAKKRDGSEVVKVLDFGIARDLDSSANNVTHTGIAMGTPHYMAPEQAMSAKGVSAAADVWAMGAMLYEALSGRPPFDGETASAIVVNACTKEHAPLSQASPSVPAALGAFVDRCLSKEPKDRPADARHMLEELRRVRQQVGAVSGSAGGAPSGSPQTGPLPGAAVGAGAATPPPGTGYGTGQPGFGASHAGPPGTPPPGAGYGTAPPGFGAPGTSPPGAGYGTGQPGFGTPPPGASGTSGAPGMPPPSGGPSGFGAPAGSGTAGPGGWSAPQPAKKRGGGGGLALGLVAALLLGGLLVVGGGVAVALVVFGSDEDGGDEPPPSTAGTVRVQTDVSAGELFVDGVSRGPVVPGQHFSVEQGPHQLEIREAGTTVATGAVTVTPGQEHTVVLNRTAPTPVPDDSPMVPGNVQTFTGSLRPDDEQLTSGEYADSYFFQWTAGSRVRIEADSSDFDTYLILKAPSGVQQDNDDREPGNFNAAIDATIQESGRWQVLVTSFSTGETGDYTLTIRGP